MGNILYGALGAIIVIGLFAAGVYFGRRYKPDSPQAPEVAKGPTPEEEKELRRLTEEQQAFGRIVNYTVEDAYGMNSSSLTSEGEER